MTKLHALGASLAFAIAAPALAQTNAPITAAPAVTPTPTTGTRADRNDTSNTHLRNDCFDPQTKSWSTRRDCLDLIPGGTASASPSPGPTIGGAATGAPDTTSGSAPGPATAPTTAPVSPAATTTASPTPRTMQGSTGTSK